LIAIPSPSRNRQPERETPAEREVRAGVPPPVKGAFVGEV
jgi:hypothetical protein